MNFLHILSEIEKVDPEIYDRLDSRRRVFKHMAGFGKKLSAAALPLAVGAVLNKAYGQAQPVTTPVPLGDILTFALRLEYLEMHFYQASTGIRSALSTSNNRALDLITTDEVNHVNFLRGVISGLPNVTLEADPGAAAFDFTGSRGGSRTALFPDVLTNVNTYLAVAQALEDTGVRAYKGAAIQPTVYGTNSIIEAALNIHSVEARHSSRIRTMRRGGALNDRASMTAAGTDLNSAPKSWISGTDNGGPAPAATAPVYGAGSTPNFFLTNPYIIFPAEDNLRQDNVRVSTNTSIPNIPASAFSEAFDEPLNVAQVNIIANNFVASATNYFTPVA